MHYITRFTHVKTCNNVCSTRVTELQARRAGKVRWGPVASWIPSDVRSPVRAVVDAEYLLDPRADQLPQAVIVQLSPLALHYACLIEYGA